MQREKQGEGCYCTGTMTMALSYVVLLLRTLCAYVAALHIEYSVLMHWPVDVCWEAGTGECCYAETTHLSEDTHWCIMHFSRKSLAVVAAQLFVLAGPFLLPHFDVVMVCKTSLRWGLETSSCAAMPSVLGGWSIFRSHCLSWHLYACPARSTPLFAPVPAPTPCCCAA